MASSLFDVRKQLTFYGSYHSHPVNIIIHIFGVPLLLWSAWVLGTLLPVPVFLPQIHHVFNEWLIFDLNVPAITFVFYLAYYLLLDPIAAILYAPQMVLSLLTATALSYQPDGITKAGVVHVVSWIAQFLGHGLAEGRAPALLDNILGAFVLAPFFVHLELLFKLGYRPALQKQLQNDVGKEIARIRKEQGDKRRSNKKAT
ncbi:hypothetical protein SERLA73DRAFT_177050 [Serpula lacrymans var. lacrymans S7.3]|uniref:DUF962-domain-containing protein n=2 Tax=Serpula lacrymans var. lacrymans TaxID=341189 RepID=F8PQS3_SERL3|nr:uncharacterized protein SERLADRAFT_460452 [Serpula lacrymans var. lacrymans S7.9]EGO01633.1 hypothetical protein SERLA73DRAFT_177050 [Serpula lacrymans var. lacrymans S7.3]EGO27288.1 hypothetical protein SERLADRAFT_460452 [Serpula lacrymans var. lacrymans S7.9]